MRTSSKWIVAAGAAILVLGGLRAADAAFVGMPGMLGQAMKRISFSNYTLAPMAFTRFCMRYADQCKPQQVLFRGGPVHLTEARWEDLKRVNRTVNAAITPEANTGGVAAERSIIYPSNGDCNDYAVSKRFE